MIEEKELDLITLEYSEKCPKCSKGILNPTKETTQKKLVLACDKCLFREIKNYDSKKY